MVIQPDLNPGAFRSDPVEVTDQLRTLVPGWVEWLGPVFFLAGLAIILGLVPLAAVRAAVLHIVPTDHWTEQARYAHAARASVVGVGPLRRRSRRLERSG